MAKGLRCRSCGDSMYAKDERHEEKGTWVTYVCRNGNCPSAKGSYSMEEKVFEDK